MIIDPKLSVGIHVYLNHLATMSPPEQWLSVEKKEDPGFASSMSFLQLQTETETAVACSYQNDLYLPDCLANALGFRVMREKGPPVYFFNLASPDALFRQGLTSFRDAMMFSLPPSLLKPHPALLAYYRDGDQKLTLPPWGGFPLINQHIISDMDQVHWLSAMIYQGYHLIRVLEENDSPSCSVPQDFKGDQLKNPLKTFFFHGRNPLTEPVPIPCSTSLPLLNSSGERMGEAFLCAGGKECILTLSLGENSHFSACTYKGPWRPRQQDAFYFAHFRDESGASFFILAGFDGAGSSSQESEVVGSAWLQGIHTEVVQNLAQKKKIVRTQLLHQMVYSGSKSMEKQARFYEVKQGCGVGFLIVVDEEAVEGLYTGDSWFCLSQRYPKSEQYFPLAQSEILHKPGTQQPLHFIHPGMLLSNLKSFYHPRPRGVLLSLFGASDGAYPVLLNVHGQAQIDRPRWNRLYRNYLGLPLRFRALENLGQILDRQSRDNYLMMHLLLAPS